MFPKINIIFIPLLVILFVSGCSTIPAMSWKHPTATTSNFYRDQNQCIREAANTFPFKTNTNISVSSSSTVYSMPKSHSGLVTTNDFQLPPKTDTLSYDIARMTTEANRDGYADRCLKGKGYYRVKRPSGYEESFIPQAIPR